MLWGSPQTSMQGVVSLRSLLLPAALTFLPGNDNIPENLKEGFILNHSM